ncbi:MAG: hypothetical protein LIP08_03230 [Bacteroides sp.]|nr:hypothetical protein [Bacteroides sp.]
MKTKELYKEVSSMLYLIRNDEKKLSQVFNLLEELDAGTPSHEIPSPGSSDYSSIVMQIADAVNEGYICFFNPDTEEIEQVACEGYFDYVEIAEQNEDMIDEFDLNYMNWDHYIRIDPLQKEDLRLIMEKYVNEMDDNKLSAQLRNVLETDQPLRNFLKKLKEAAKEDVWNVFKKQEIINYVKERLAEVELPEE